MTPDEARKLLGGYATGALSPSEQKALFEAALEDQDLFEELAGEQALKEVLEQPGARERLIAALAPASSRAAWWMRPWPWAAAAAVAVAVSIGITFVSRRQIVEPLPQIAEVRNAPETPVPQAAPAAPPPPAPAPRKLEKPAPPPPAVAPAPLADALEKAGTAASPSSAAAAPRAQNETVTVTATFIMCFSYDVRADGSLQITVLEPGFLSVTASYPFPKKESDLLPSTAVERSRSVRLQVPSDATGIVIGFSKTPGVNEAPIQQVPASGLGISTDSRRGQVRIQPTPLFLKLDPR